MSLQQVLIRAEAVSRVLKLPVVLTPDEIKSLTSLDAWNAYRTFRMINDHLTTMPGNHWYQDDAQTKSYEWKNCPAGNNPELLRVILTERGLRIIGSVRPIYPSHGPYSLKYSSEHQVPPWVLTMSDQNHSAFFQFVRKLDQELGGEIRRSLGNNSILT